MVCQVDGDARWLAHMPVYGRFKGGAIGEKFFQGGHPFRFDCRHRVPRFLLRAHRKVHGCNPKDFLSPHFLRVQRVCGLWNLLLCESSIRLHTRGEIGLVGRIGCGSRAGLYHRGADSPGERPVPAGSVARQRGRFAKGGGGSMKNLDSVLAAYLAGWAIFFVYYISVAQRLSTLREEVERLKALLTKGR